MRALVTVLMLLILTPWAFGRIIYVDKNGPINSIQAGINVAAAGDTVKVLPGTYEEQVVLNKDILLMGSGYENTIISGSFDPTVEIKSGIMQWFMVTSLGGNGVKIGGGQIRNCVIKGCSTSGIYNESGTAYVENCVIINNGEYGILTYRNNDGVVYVVNCISWNNSRDSYLRSGGGWSLNVSYSIGNYWGGITGGQGLINSDPQFTSSDDYHIGSDSPGWDAGNPSLSDPDGSRSDMGYFGGPNCPIYPVVTSIKLIPLENGGVRVEATGRANY